MVIDKRKNAVLSGKLDDLLGNYGIEFAPVTAAQVQIARKAFRKYGKGMKNPAQLNFGDCFAYALAKETGEPLLFKGSDFGHTDIVPAIPK
jgi:ribonuclease VapC